MGMGMGLKTGGLFVMFDTGDTGRGRWALANYLGLPGAETKRRVIISHLAASCGVGEGC